jgi:hypothetical protein
VCFNSLSLLRLRLLIRRERGAHAGLVGGVGARPVREVGDEEEEGWRAAAVVVVVAVLGVEEEDGCGQALAPRDGGVTEGAVGVVADLVEAIAHEVGVGLDGAGVGEVDGTVDVGSEVEGGGGSGTTTTAADGEAQALLQRVARTAVDALERAPEERWPGVVAHPLDGLLFFVMVRVVIVRVVIVRLEKEEGGAPGRAEKVGLLREAEVEGGRGAIIITTMMTTMHPGAVDGALGGDGEGRGGGKAARPLAAAAAAGVVVVVGAHRQRPLLHQRRHHVVVVLRGNGCCFYSAWLLCRLILFFTLVWLFNTSRLPLQSHYYYYTCASSPHHVRLFAASRLPLRCIMCASSEPLLHQQL